MEDTITFTGPVKIAVAAGGEEISVLWRWDDIPHVFRTGNTRRYLEKERPDVELGPKAEQFPTLKPTTTEAL